MLRHLAHAAAASSIEEFSIDWLMEKKWVRTYGPLATTNCFRGGDRPLRRATCQCGNRPIRGRDDLLPRACHSRGAHAVSFWSKAWKLLNWSPDGRMHQGCQEAGASSLAVPAS